MIWDILSVLVVFVLILVGTIVWATLRRIRREPGDWFNLVGLMQKQMQNQSAVFRQRIILQNMILLRERKDKIRFWGKLHTKFEAEETMDALNKQYEEWVKK